MHSVMGPNTKDPQSMLAKECTVPDAQADLSPERSTHQFAESDDLNGRNVSTPSILGIWRVGSSIYASDHCVISLGQPADAIDNPRWEYAIKTFTTSHNQWTVKREISQIAEAGRLISHPNLLGVLDASATASNPYVVMPRLMGNSMQALLGSQEETSLPVAIWMTRQIAEALAAIHQAGWIHARVSPDHILLSSTGHATLINMGYSQKIHTSIPDQEVQDSSFASPEYLAGDHAAIAAMDTFSLGRILWQWLTITSCESSTLLERVATLVEQMVAPDPNERPTMESVVAKLKELEFSVLGLHIGPNSALRTA